jgi:hypothetical protein
VHEALGGAFPKRHHVDCGLIAIICKVPVLGRYKLVSEPGFVDTHGSSQSACRLTLPTDVVVSIVKTIFVKNELDRSE